MRKFFLAGTAALAALLAACGSVNDTAATESSSAASDCGTWGMAMHAWNGYTASAQVVTEVAKAQGCTINQTTLDEASVLKQSARVLRNNLVRAAQGIEYKLACSATPAPNDLEEYVSQANTSLGVDGGIKHYHVFFKVEPEITLVTNQQKRQWNVSEHFTAFD